MRDRWQLFEYLKKHNGLVNSNLIRGMDKNEIIEGLEEYYYYLDLNNHVSLRKNDVKNTKSIDA